MIDESNGSDAFKRVSIGKLDALVGAGRNRGLPAQPPARLFRRSAARHGNCGNCDNCLSPPRVRDGKVARAEAFVLRLSHRAALRRHAPDRRAGRPPDRTRHAIRPRQIVGVRHRPRAQRKAVARRAAPIGGDGPSARRQRGVWRAEADRYRARRAEGRDRSDAARAGGKARATAPSAPSRAAANSRRARRPGQQPRSQPCTPR